MESERCAIQIAQFPPCSVSLCAHARSLSLCAQSDLHMLRKFPREQFEREPARDEHAQQCQRHGILGTRAGVSEDGDDSETKGEGTDEAV